MSNFVVLANARALTTDRQECSHSQQDGSIPLPTTFHRPHRHDREERDEEVYQEHPKPLIPARRAVHKRRNEKAEKTVYRGEACVCRAKGKRVMGKALGRDNIVHLVRDTYLHRDNAERVDGQDRTDEKYQAEQDANPIPGGRMARDRRKLGHRDKVVSLFLCPHNTRSRGISRLI